MAGSGETERRRVSVRSHFFGSNRPPSQILTVSPKQTSTAATDGPSPPPQEGLAGDEMVAVSGGVEAGEGKESGRRKGE